MGGVADGPCAEQRVADMSWGIRKERKGEGRRWREREEEEMVDRERER